MHTPRGFLVDRSGPLIRRILRWTLVVVLNVLVTGALLLGFYVYRIGKIPRYPIRVAGSPFMQRDPEIGYVPVPHGDTAIQHLDSGAAYHVTNDRFGARVNRPGDETPARVDLMTLGCSFTWGFGVRNEDTYAQRLGMSLGVSTANFAMAGYGSIQSLQMLRRHRELRPRTVIYGVIDVHLNRNVSACAPSFAPFCVPTPYFEADGSGGRIHPPLAGVVGFDSIRREIVTQETRRPRDLLVAALWAMRADLVHYTRGGRRHDASAEAMNDSIRFAIGQMADTTREIGADLIVVYMPYVVAGGSLAPPPAALAKAVSEAHVRIVDVTPTFTAYLAQHPGTLLGLTARDGHPNRIGHQLIAEQIAASIQRPH